MNSNTLLTTGNRDTKEKTTENGENGDEKTIAVEVERKTGISFPLKLSDGKELKAVGVRKKNLLGFSIKIYSFGIYADNEILMGVLRSKIVKAEAKATKDMYSIVIDNPVGITVKMVIVFPNLTTSMVRNNFNETVGAAVKKLGGEKSDLTKRIMGEAKDGIKLTLGSEIEITCLPGYVLETKVHGKVVNKFESELLCRACVYLYLGDDPLDKEAKEKFGMSLLSLI
ncbi:chalcone isomerase-like protein 1 [Bidens hawaiensis]|uniref:chalcone isomerase-like protein 1 n=1 Tax=Bidens hawaiensis TaxID=980011 RepID=UPI00404A391A